MKPPSPFDGVAWTPPRLAEGLRRLAQALDAHAPDQSQDLAPFADGITADTPRLAEWLEESGARLGMEITAAQIPYADLSTMLGSNSPALITLHDPAWDTPRHLLFMRGERRWIWVIAPDRPGLCRIPRAVVHVALRAPLAAPHSRQLAELLDGAGVQGRKRAIAEERLLSVWLRQSPISGIFHVTQTSPRELPGLLRGSSLPQLLSRLLWNHGLTLLLTLLAGLLLSDSVLWGRAAWGWLWGWGLAVLSLAPLEGKGLWLEGQMAIRFYALLGERLLQGTFTLLPHSLRSAGIGQFMGMVLEGDLLARLLVQAVPAALSSLLELALFAILLLFTEQYTLLAFFGLMLGGLGILIVRAQHALPAVVGSRMQLSARLTELMVGHRTRVVQQPRAYWHTREDGELADYQLTMARADRIGLMLLGVLPRAWLFLGLLALLPRLLSQPSTASLALGLAFLLWGQRAYIRLAQAGLQLVASWLTYQRLQPLLQSAAQPLPLGARLFFEPPSPLHQEPDTLPQIELMRASFRYPSRDEAVLQQTSLRIHRGERILLEGPSGGGKSTLAALLLGLEVPTSGSVLLAGLDLGTWGPRRWRRCIAGAPQFHVNHIFSDSLAFNLLMGRRWPPAAQDIREAEAVCQAIGLMPLIERMPAGMLQGVGDGGWQLSHGEKSRIFLARALLQQTDALLLDESFAALDPATLRICLGYVRQRPETLVVIAHP